VIVKTGGIIYKENGLVWLKPYKSHILFECVPACYISEYPKRGNWFVYIDIPQGGSPVAYLFSSLDDYRLWDKLRGLKNVGAKRAAGILSSYPSEYLLKIIAYGDENTLASVKGIGKKTAHRIIAELMEEISLNVSEISEIKHVLVSWGYDKKDVDTAFAKLYAKGAITDNMKFDDILRKVMQVIDDETDRHTT
jgi:ribosomal protein S13